MRTCASRNELLHLAHGLLKADPQRTGDNAVADIEFAHLGDRGNGPNVVIRQPVPSVQDHAALGHRTPGIREFHQLGQLRLAGFGQGVLAGMQLNGIRAQLAAGFDLSFVGVEEQADRNIGGVQPVDGHGQAVSMGDDVEPPSVVISARFSGTSVAWSGRVLQAMSRISSLVASSRFSLTLTVSRSRRRSRSWMCRRSSRK